VKQYTRETHDTVRRFRHRHLSFATCISRLDEALVRFMLRMKIEDRDELRVVMLANNEAVMKEVARRG
jgi:hypothetical protein